MIGTLINATLMEGTNWLTAALEFPLMIIRFLLSLIFGIEF